MGRKRNGVGSSKNHQYGNEKTRKILSLRKKKRLFKRLSYPSVASPTLACSDTSNLTSTEETENVRRLFDNKSGFIFMCNRKTKLECYQFRVFGLPVSRMEVVREIKPGAKLFLYDCDVKLLYGIYKATSEGGSGLEPTAFEGKFPAQVRFKIVKDCLPLHESAFRHAIIDNYQGGRKFRQELNSKQVKALILLFRPLDVQLGNFVDSPLPSVAVQCALPRSHDEEEYQSPSRLPHEDPYYPAAYHPHGQPVKVDSSSSYDHHGPMAHVAHIQPRIEPAYFAREASCTHDVSPYHLPKAHQEYLPEKPELGLDQYRSSIDASEMIPRDQIGGNKSQCCLPQLSREKDFLLSEGDLHIQQLASSVALHTLFLSRTLAPTYNQPYLMHAPADLQLVYHPYYTIPVHDSPDQVHVDPLERVVRSSWAEPNAPVSAL